MGVQPVPTMPEFSLSKFSVVEKTDMVTAQEGKVSWLAAFGSQTPKAMFMNSHQEVVLRNPILLKRSRKFLAQMNVLQWTKMVLG